MTARTVIITSGTRAESEATKRAVWDALLPFKDLPYVILIHGAATGADTYAKKTGMHFGWEVHGYPYFKDLGAAGGPKRNVAMTGVAQVLLRAGFVGHGLAFPDDKSVGTRGAIVLMRGVGIEPVVRDGGAPMKAEYATWIAAFLDRTPILLGECDRATKEMVVSFPELTRVAGHVYCSWGKRGHFWCSTTDGVVVDPTRGQFPGPVTYEPWSPGEEVHAGRCMECGADIWLPLMSLGEAPHNPHAPFCSNECGVKCTEAMS